MVKLTAYALVGVAVTLGVGWVWGASGRGEAEQAQRAAELRADFAEARALVLEARVHLFTNNFGSAGRALDRARPVIAGLQARLRETGQAERAGRLEIVLGHVGEAGRYTLAVDARAQNAAEAALDALAAASTP
jgi:hypothetical protein